MFIYTFVITPCTTSSSINYELVLTTVPIGCIPPVDTDSCFRALRGIGLQGGAVSGIAIVASVRLTNCHKWTGEYDSMARCKNTRRNTQARTVCQEKRSEVIDWSPSDQRICKHHLIRNGKQFSNSGTTTNHFCQQFNLQN